MERKQINLAEALEFMGIDEMAEFKPTAYYNVGLDLLIYVEKDVSYTSRLVPESNMSILYSNTSPEKVVGFELWGFSKVYVPQDPMPHDTSQLKNSGIEGPSAI